MTRLKTLLFYAQDTDTLSYYDDWLDAFRESRFFDCEEVNTFHGALHPDLVAAADLVVLLHSVLRTPKNLRQFLPLTGKLDSRRGKLLSFVGDELNLPDAPLGDKIGFLRSLGPDYIATQLPLEAGEWLYGDCAGARVVEITHALNPYVYFSSIPHPRRRVDIGAICTRYPPYLGDDERDRIYGFFESKGGSLGITVDIRYLDKATKRLNRSEWSAFLNDCRGTVSTEAGTYYLEKDDRTVRAVIEHILASHEGGGGKLVNLKWFWNILPQPLYRFFLERRDGLAKLLAGFGVSTRDNLLSAANPEEIYERFFKNRARPPVYTKAISSRHLEAAGTRTCQILFEGRYNGILLADKHYLALRKDFSNMDDVMGRFRDASLRQKMVDEAFEHVMSGHTFRHRIEYIANLMGI